MNQKTITDILLGFKYIGHQPGMTAKEDLRLYNCDKPKCPEYQGTITQNYIYEHYKKHKKWHKTKE